MSCVEEKSKPGLVHEMAAPSGDAKVDMADHQKESVGSSGLSFKLLFMVESSN